MPTLQIEHPISDFEVWTQAFEADPVRREESGVKRYRVFRPLDDPRYVKIDLDFRQPARGRGLPCRAPGSLGLGPRRPGAGGRPADADRRGGSQRGVLIDRSTRCRPDLISRPKRPQTARASCRVRQCSAPLRLCPSRSLIQVLPRRRVPGPICTPTGVSSRPARWRGSRPRRIGHPRRSRPRRSARRGCGRRWRAACPGCGSRPAAARGVSGPHAPRSQACRSARPPPRALGQPRRGCRRSQDRGLVARPRTPSAPERERRHRRRSSRALSSRLFTHSRARGARSCLTGLRGL
jgi:hypothetical protein